MAAPIVLLAFVALSFAAIAEPCGACDGCETGVCDDDGLGSASDHHCCLVSCMAHTMLTLPAAPSSPAPAASELRNPPFVTSLAAPGLEPLDRPPRA